MQVPMSHPLRPGHFPGYADADVPWVPDYTKNQKIKDAKKKKDMESWFNKDLTLRSTSTSESS